MMLKQERSNPNTGAVSFLVDIPRNPTTQATFHHPTTHSMDTAAEPEIKKRLEAYSSIAEN